MKRRMLDIFVCVICQHWPLDLTVLSENGEEIVEGILGCSACGQQYPIEDTIPILWPTNPPCRYCGELIDTDLWMVQEGDSDPKRGFREDRTEPYHCIEEALAAEQSFARKGLGRPPDPRITGVMLERGISREAARKWLKRHH